MRYKFCIRSNTGHNVLDLFDFLQDKHERRVSTFVGYEDYIEGSFHFLGISSQETFTNIMETYFSGAHAFIAVLSGGEDSKKELSKLINELPESAKNLPRFLLVFRSQYAAATQSRANS